jgi:hypothetical protein
MTDDVIPLGPGAGPSDEDDRDEALPGHEQGDRRTADESVLPEAPTHAEPYVPAVTGEAVDEDHGSPA